MAKRYRTESKEGMLVKVYGATVQGLQAVAVTIEVNATRGCRFVMVGLPMSASWQL